MAAATVASTSRDRAGDFRVILRSYTALADTNTDALPFPGAQILGVFPVKVSTSACVTATWSNQTLTCRSRSARTGARSGPDAPRS